MTVSQSPATPPAPPSTTTRPEPRDGGSGPNAVKPEVFHTPFGPMTLDQYIARFGSDDAVLALAEGNVALPPLPCEAKQKIARERFPLPMPIPVPKPAPQGPRPAPAEAPPPSTKPPRRRQRLVHWRAAAVMIARGVGITYVAQDAGVCESVILRNIKRSARFRRWIREAEAAVEADAARHAAWLRLRAASSLADRAEGRDPKTLELLARQIADLARNRVGEAAEARPETAYARLSGYSKKDFRG